MRRRSITFLPWILLLALPPSLHAQATKDEPAPASPATVSPPAPPGAMDDGVEAERNRELVQAAELIGEKRQTDAIRNLLDPLIAEYEKQYADRSVRVYCPRTSAEALIYMVGEAAAQDKGTATHANSVAIAPTWAYAYYMKAYALVELQQPAQAMEALQKALRLAPSNPQFLSESAQLQKSTGDWQGMLALYEQAYANTEFASPDELKQFEQARALRGQGYALIELDRLDEARRMFEKSLQLEPGNAIAEGELEYIGQIEKKQQ